MKLRTAAFGLALLVMHGAAAVIAGPFSNMAGSWSGSGVLYKASGQNDRLRCRATYDVERDGNQVALRIRCASDSYKFDLTGYVLSDGGKISGQWSEPNYNSAGTLTGSASVGNLNAHAIGNTFSAVLSVTTRDNQQSVTIQPQDMDVARVVLTLRKT